MAPAPQVTFQLFVLAKSVQERQRQAFCIRCALESGVGRSLLISGQSGHGPDRGTHPSIGLAEKKLFSALHEKNKMKVSSPKAARSRAGAFFSGGRFPHHQSTICCSVTSSNYCVLAVIAAKG